MSQSSEFQSTMRQLEGLLADVESIGDPAAHAKTARIIQGLMEFHGAAIGAIFDKLQRSQIQELAGDELISNLLLLYGMHPVDIETRVNRGLEKVKPYLRSHGGNVELLGVSEDGIVRLSLQGSCHSCPSSALTMKTSVEQAIYEAAPDVSAIEVDGLETQAPSSPNGFVPLEMLIHSAGKAHLQGAPT